MSKVNLEKYAEYRTKVTGDANKPEEFYLWLVSDYEPEAGRGDAPARIVGPCESLREAIEWAEVHHEKYDEKIVAIYNKTMIENASYSVSYSNGFDKIAAVAAIEHNDGEPFDKDPYMKGFSDGFQTAKETNE
jgi:hypothetical protein